MSHSSRMYPQEPITPTSPTGAYHPQSGVAQPGTRTSTETDAYPAPAYPHSQTTYSGTQSGGPAGSTAVPFDTLARIVSRIDVVHKTMEERLGKMEEAAKQANNVAERLEKVENELKANREKASQEHMSIITFLNGMSSRFSQRLKIVGDRIERVERGLGPNYYEEVSVPPGGDPHAADNLPHAGTSVMDKLKTMECLMNELLEKANDPDALKQDIITEDRGMNTDTVDRVNVAVQCLSSPDTCDIGVGGSIHDSAISAASQEHQEEVHIDLIMNHPTPSDVNATSTQPDTAAVAMSSNLQAHLGPASWQEEPLSELSSRSTSPGLTVRGLRLAFAREPVHAVEGPSGSFSPGVIRREAGSSASFETSHSHLSLQQIYPPPPSTPTEIVSPASPTFGFPRDIPLPITASSRAVSALLGEGGSRSPSIEDAHRSSVECLFDEDVEFVTPDEPESSKPREKTPEYVPAVEGPESEEELDTCRERLRTASNDVRPSPPASARVPARRRRSPSLDSLSSLSSVPTSPSSSIAAERQIRHCDSLPTPLPRPRKKRRRAEPALATSSTSASGRSVKKKGAKKSEYRPELGVSSKWEVIHGYNGPCQWPETVDDDKSCRNLVKCDDCDCWYHLGCVGIAANDSRVTSDDFWFTCPPCETSKEKHGIARKVRSTNSDECARPGCTLDLATGEFFLERIIGRKPHNEQLDPPPFLWLFKWEDYPVKSATWELDHAFNSNRDEYIAKFENAARALGLSLDNPLETVLLPEAVQVGWK